MTGSNIGIKTVENGYIFLLCNDRIIHPKYTSGLVKPALSTILKSEQLVKKSFLKKRWRL